ncbi:hypothetical protein JYK00_00020 [Thermosipho ferrireducens]|uniref:Uncharacterized protein n=1 Tax=Thermosipho ferrireducens TaxID=2571116 RepID=A0ABX7S5Z5_9BACT|nr:hypothetical protein [Thermosipho ferrireducens]QTA37984.1 hypothetical protein JYK00_00020 [Thermosipho ferrireducens]
MKHFVSVIIMVIFVTTIFGLDLQKAESIYLNYLEAYSKKLDEPFVNDIRPIIERELPLYRFYKIRLVGSVEKTDVTKKVGDYLNVIYRKFKGTSEEEQFARAAFFAYLEAILERKKFGPSFIKASPNFNQFFNSYQNKVIFAARSYFTDLLAAHLGADIELPYDIDAPHYNFEFNYKPRYKGGYDYEIKYLTSSEELIKAFSSYVELLSKKKPEIIGKSIGRYGGLMQRNIIKVIAGLKNDYSEKIAEITPKAANFWWIRWFVYGGLLAIIFYMKKNWELILTLISISEIIYLFIAFDSLSTGNAALYGLISFFAFLSSIYIFFKNRRYLQFSMAILLLISLFVPTFFIKELVMANNSGFDNSVYYDTLFGDVVKDQYSKFSNIIKNLTSIVNSSIGETEDIVQRLKIRTKALDGKIKDENYMNVVSFEKRIFDVKNIEDELENYQIEEGIRYKQYKSSEKALKSFSKKLSRIVDEKFEADYLKELGKKLYYPEIQPTLSKIEETIKNVEDSKSAPATFIKEKWGIITFLTLSIAMFLSAVNFKQDVLWYVASIISGILMLINPLDFLVQYGVPILKVNYSFAIPIVLIPVVVLTIVRILKPSRKGV